MVPNFKIKLILFLLDDCTSLLKPSIDISSFLAETEFTSYIISDLCITTWQAVRFLEVIR